MGKDRWGRVHSALAALAMVALVAGCVGQGVAPSGAATPQHVPSSTPRATLALDRTFVSPLYGYAVDHPRSFDERPATVPLQGTAPPLFGEPIVDRLESSDTAAMVLASAELPAGVENLDAWTAATARAFCGTPTSSESMTVGGANGTLDTFGSCQGYFHQWLTMVRDGRGYHVVWLSEPGSEAADRSLFLGILETFEFGGPSGSPGATSSSVPAGMRPLQPGEPIPDALLGTWSHASGGFMWFLRAGDPACLQRPRTVQDCLLWQSAGRPIESAIVAVMDGRLQVHWTQGGCAGRATYSYGLVGDDRLTMGLVGGCQSGDFVLTRAGTGTAPSAPPPPTP
jgi:hypothetical protein